MAYLSRPHLRVAIAWLVAGALLGCKPASNDTPAATASAVSTLESTDLTRGSGAAVAAGQYAVVQYTGWLYEPSAPEHKGKEFDSSLKSGTPFRFQLGAGQVIKGWDQGVAGMQIGGKRRLVIPPDLGYGDS